MNDWKDDGEQKFVKSHHGALADCWGNTECLNPAAVAYAEKRVSTQTFLKKERRTYPIGIGERRFSVVCFFGRKRFYKFSV